MQQLDDEDVQRFLDDGFVRLEGAFSRALADACLEIVWREAGCDPNDAATWAQPVVRVGDHYEPPFREAAHTPALRAAFDRLVGPGRWLRRGGLGTFPIRFPHAIAPTDAGWHADAGFVADDGTMRLDVTSRGRALLMLFLLTEVGPDDAPTRIRVGSHLDVPRVLEPLGSAGGDVFALPWDTIGADRPIAHATGQPGDVYLCHPFLVHAAQAHLGSRPRVIAQPPLLPAEPIAIERADEAYSPVERAIRIGLGRE